MKYSTIKKAIKPLATSLFMAGALSTTAFATPTSGEQSVSVVQAFLADATNPENVYKLVDSNAKYISLNFDNPELKKLMPWAGTSYGPDAFISTFDRVFKFWKAIDFKVVDIFGNDEQVAAFGTFTYQSVVTGKIATSPFSIHAKVEDGKIVYFQFMEDTFATAGTFKLEGRVDFKSNPKGEIVTLTEFSER